VLTAAAILPGGTAAADPSQDDKFFALLGQKDIPPVEKRDEPHRHSPQSLFQLDGGMSVEDLVDLIRNNGFKRGPEIALGSPPARHVHHKPIITAAVQAYCRTTEAR